MVLTRSFPLLWFLAVLFVSKWSKSSVTILSRGSDPKSVSHYNKYTNQLSGNSLHVPLVSWPFRNRERLLFSSFWTLYTQMTRWITAIFPFTMIFCNPNIYISIMFCFWTILFSEINSVDNNCINNNGTQFPAIYSFFKTKFKKVSAYNCSLQRNKAVLSKDNSYWKSNQDSYFQMTRGFPHLFPKCCKSKIVSHLKLFWFCFIICTQLASKLGLYPNGEECLQNMMFSNFISLSIGTNISMSCTSRWPYYLLHEVQERHCAAFTKSIHMYVVKYYRRTTMAFSAMLRTSQRQHNDQLLMKSTGKISWKMCSV